MTGSLRRDKVSRLVNFLREPNREVELLSKWADGKHLPVKKPCYTVENAVESSNDSIDSDDVTAFIGLDGPLPTNRAPT